MLTRPSHSRSWLNENEGGGWSQVAIPDSRRCVGMRGCVKCCRISIARESRTEGSR